MAAEYKLIIRTPAGQKKAIVPDYDWLAYTRRVNGIDVLQFEFSGNHRAAPYLIYMAQVQVYRRDLELGLDWVKEVDAFYMGPDREYRKRLDRIRANCLGTNFILASRYVLWPAGLTGRSAFMGVAGDSIMKSLALYNAGAQALSSNGRDINGVWPNFAIDTDTAAGSPIDWYCANQNLLETLRKLAKVAGFDFAVSRTGPSNWLFKTYAGQLGADLSDTVTFSLQLGNMANPRYSYSKAGQATVALVAGQMQGAVRAKTAVYAADWTTSNHIELFVDARDIDDPTRLETRGLEKLEAVRAKQLFNFDIRQTKSCSYRKDYNLGDKVTAVRWFDKQPVIQKLVSIAVSQTKGAQENITVEMENVA